MTRTALLALALAACGGTEPLTMELDLRGGSECTPLRLAPVMSVSVQVLGRTPDNEACVVDQLCVAVDRPTSVDDIEAELRDPANQPLFDLPDTELAQLAVVGHRGVACDGEQDLCGVADIDSGRDGELAVDVTCEAVLIDDRCGSAQPPLCP